METNGEGPGFVKGLSLEARPDGRSETERRPS